MPFTSSTWSAVAAWVALAISIICPLITAILNNYHQRKMYSLKRANNRLDLIISERQGVFSAFISNAGKCLSVNSIENISDFGSTFFAIYQYVPEEHWAALDQFYLLILHSNWDDARAAYISIVHMLADISKRPPL